MGNLDINALKLTDEEYLQFLYRIASDAGDGAEFIQLRKALDAQLAKAVWGLKDWIDGTHEPIRGSIGPLWFAEMIEREAEAAGIPRPEQKKAGAH